MNKIVPADDAVDLRRGIDHIGVCVNFVVHDGKGNLLMQKRSQNCRDEQGRWDVGGGAVEFGETLEQALKREVMEELTATPLKIDYLSTYDAHREHEGNKTHWIAISYAVQVDPKAVKIGEPHKVDEIGWFTMRTLPSPLHSQCHKSYQVAHQKGFIQ
jgi:ADP-ribose pyrophosphatase YjhB (NUDIX family)